LRQKAVVITFDDGWLDNFIYAFPVLEKYKLRAAMFIVTDWIEKASERPNGIPSSKPSYEESKASVRKGEEQEQVLTWERIGKMANSGLIDFYSHTKSHPSCNNVSEPELLRELEQSRRIVEERLGRPCPYLCWPYGLCSDTAIAISRKAGYKALFTIEHGVVKAGSDLFAIKRILIKDNVAWFRTKMLIYTNPVLSKLYLKYLKAKRR
jgi:peptidoglycan/xylan/chitin deacetylase (PgdA/CDA1 family)